MLATLKFSKLRQLISIFLRLIQTVDSLRLIQTDSVHVVAICTRHGCRHVLVFYLPFSLSVLLKVI